MNRKIIRLTTLFLLGICLPKVVLAEDAISKFAPQSLQVSELIDSFWILLCAFFVFLMQAGFLCVETGLTRNKNNINVAVKNLTDFAIAVTSFWLIGFGLMFGNSLGGWLGNNHFAFNYGNTNLWQGSFFLYQATFCGTAVTILSGAVAERMRFGAYLLVAALISSFIYPVFGHWAWHGLDTGESAGWLIQQGFVDFAGSTVVHSVGGWVSLACLCIVGSRKGKFTADGKAQHIPASNLPIATLGVLILWFGWIGFNGGSTLHFNDRVALIIGNTLIAGASGLLIGLGWSWLTAKRAEIELLMNGSLAGLVAITANCFAVSPGAAFMIGLIGGLVMILVLKLLEIFQIDDAVGAIPVHLGAGMWGMIAVAIFGKSELLATGLNFWQQLRIQFIGVFACAIWTFVVSFIILWLINRFFPLRVSVEDELVGLNIAEHGARTDILDLFDVMEKQGQTGDLNLRAPVEPFTEVGQMARRYNALMDSLQTTMSNLQQKTIALKERSTALSKANEEIIELNEKLKAENLRMGAELDVARQIQSMILPKIEELESVEGLDIAGYMEPADEVVLYTDGIPEAFDINKKQYGMERLCEVISHNWQHSAQEIKQAVIDDVRAFIGKQKVFDDITLVVLKQQ